MKRNGRTFLLEFNGGGNQGYGQMPDEEGMQGMGGEMMPMDDPEMQDGGAMQEEEPIVGIRRLSFQGIQNNDPLGETPNEEMYELYKKIWVMCDKIMLSDGDSGREGRNEK